MIFLNPHASITNNSPGTITNQSGSAVYISEVPDAKNNDNPAEVPSPTPVEPISRHPEFFFDNTLIAIQIENTLFNVHKYQLAKSEFFSEIFKSSKPKDDSPEEGSSPEHPIVIHGAAAGDFTALLRVLYASHFSSHQPAPEGALIIPAFRLANLLSFSELRAYLLPLAEKSLDDVDKIVFAREFDIKEWIAPAYIRLCQRDEVLSTEEARKLEVDSVLMIWRIREQNRGRKPTYDTNHFACYNCVGLECYAHSGSLNTCVHCGAIPGALLQYRGTCTTGKKTSIDDTGLEAEVTKWVEGTFATKTRN